MFTFFLKIIKRFTECLSFLILVAIVTVFFLKTDFQEILLGFQSKDELNSKEIQAEIVEIIDGDTFVVKTYDDVIEKVRLLLIDTPESVHPKEEKQLFSEEILEYIESIVQKGDKITLELGEKERDKYGRLLAYVWVNNINLNKQLVEKGYARVAYVEEPNTKYLEEFIQAENVAKENKCNIWSIDGYVTDSGFDMSVIN